MTDQIPTNLFEQLYQRAPTLAERHRLLTVKAAMGLSDRDELWPVFLTLDNYASANIRARNEIIKALKDLPAQVKCVVDQSEAAASGAANRAIAQAVDRSAERLTELMSRRSAVIQDRLSKKQFIAAASLGGLIVFIAFAAGGAGSYFVTQSLFGICTSGFFEVEGGGLGCYVD